MILKQLLQTPIPVLVTLSGAPVVGLTYQNVVVNYLRPSDTTFIAFVPTALQWLEIGNGYYHLILDPGSVLLYVGPVVVQLSAQAPASIHYVNFDSQTINLDVIPQTIDDQIPPASCQLYGNLIGADTLPQGQQDIYLRIAEQPFVSGSSVGVNSRVATRTDAQGNFSVLLPRLAIVVIDIPDAGIRRQFTVPDQVSISLTQVLLLPS